MTLLVDVHAHLDHPMMAEIDGVIERAKAAGIKAIITNGLNPESNRKTLELAKKYDIVKAALGVFPIDGIANVADTSSYPSKLKPFDVDEEIDFIAKNKSKMVAIGECGLDDHWVKDALDYQKDVFDKMVGVAEKFNKPVIVHSRDAELQCVELLESSSLKKVVMHCFGGNLKLIKRVADNGWSFSIPTNIVHSQHFQRIVQDVDSSLLLTETDCPFLSPFKGERNEPSFITESLKKIAEIKKMDVEETSKVLFMNYQKMF